MRHNSQRLMDLLFNQNIIERYLLMGNNQCCQQLKNQQYTSQIGQNLSVQPIIPIQKPLEQSRHNQQSSQPPPIQIVNPLPEPNHEQPSEQPQGVLPSKGSRIENFQSELKQFEIVDSHSINKQLQKMDIPAQKMDIPAQKMDIHVQKMDIPSQKIAIPELNSLIKGKINAEKYYEDNFLEETSVRKYGEEVYQGYLDQESRPHSYGKMYKSDGSIYIGQFLHGKAEGEGVFLMPDGLIYKGSFHNNQAQGKGIYEYEGLVYTGHFSNSRFHGSGEEVTQQYQFVGQYSEGSKVFGTFKWKDSQNREYIYKGHFNSNNQFHGQGTLEQPTGIYTGQFINGMKEGKGIYKHKNGVRYEGQYVKGKKSGMGALYSFNNKISYEGEFSNDMPHGRGFAFDGNGNKSQTMWVQGIDSVLL